MNQPSEQEPQRSTPTPDSAFPESPQPREIRIPLPQLPSNVTYTIIGVTVFVYLLQLLSSTFGYNYNGIDIFELYGARFNAAIRAGELWRFITPVFLHGSIPHIFFNMYALLSIGSFLERHHGHFRFALLYFLGGFSGNVFSFLLGSENGFSVGASTAVFGLVAAEVVFFYQNRELFGGYARQAMNNAIFIIVINLAIGLTPGIDNWGHVGGLLGGAMFAWFASPLWKVAGVPPQIRLEDQRELRDWVTGTALVLLVFGLLAVWGLLR